MRSQPIILIGLLLMAPLWLIAGPITESEAPIPEEFSGLRCRRSAEKILNEWEPTGPWQNRLSPQGTPTSWSPTKTVGVWVELRREGEANLAARRLSRELALEVMWLRADCRPAISPTPLDYRVLPREFGDSELREHLAIGDPGIILLWSPHMPLSITAVERAVKAAKRSGVRALVLLDPEADAGLAAAQAKQKNWPRAYLRPANSLELQMRGAGIHYPNTFYFSGGKIQPTMTPGLTSVRNYQRLIQAQARPLESE